MTEWSPPGAELRLVESDRLDPNLASFFGQAENKRFRLLGNWQSVGLTKENEEGLFAPLSLLTEGRAAVRFTGTNLRQEAGEKTIRRLSVVETDGGMFFIKTQGLTRAEQELRALRMMQDGGVLVAPMRIFIPKGIKPVTALTVTRAVTLTESQPRQLAPNLKDWVDQGGELNFGQWQLLRQLYRAQAVTVIKGALSPGSDFVFDAVTNWSNIVVAGNGDLILVDSITRKFAEKATIKLFQGMTVIEHGPAKAAMGRKVLLFPESEAPLLVDQNGRPIVFVDPEEGLDKRELGRVVAKPMNLV